MIYFLTEGEGDDLVIRYKYIADELQRFGGKMSKMDHHEVVPIEGYETQEDLEYYIFDRMVDGKIICTLNMDKYNSIGWSGIRNKRNMLLSETDYIALPDVSNVIYTKKCYKNFVEYRQTLRDLPSKYENHKDVVFPLKPVIEKN